MSCGDLYLHGTHTSPILQLPHVHLVGTSKMAKMSGRQKKSDETNEIFNILIVRFIILSYIVLNLIPEPLYTLITRILHLSATLYACSLMLFTTNTEDKGTEAC